MGSRRASGAIVGAMPAKSRSPLASPANLVVGSSTTAMTSSRMRGGPPMAAGNASFRANVQRCPGTRLTNRNGPLPTGSVLNAARRIPARGVAASRCAGSTGSSARIAGTSRCGVANRITTDVSVGASTVSTDARSPARAKPVR